MPGAMSALCIPRRAEHLGSRSPATQRSRASVSSRRALSERLVIEMQRRWGGPLVLAGIGALSIAPPLPARANPCAMEYVAGRHVYVGAPQKDVFIDDETIQFRTQRTPLERFVVDISVAYTLVNRGPARRVVIGFPVGGAELSSFRVVVDGVGGRVLPTAEEQANWKTGMDLSRCESEPSADSTKSPFEWYLWSQSLGVGTRW